jgi:hypothetical protein
LVSNSSYISTEDIEKTIDSGKSHCKLCKSMAQNNINGKPLISLKELKKIGDIERRAKENLKNIKISKDNKYCYCQLCSARIKMLHSVLHEDRLRYEKEIKELEDKHERIKCGELKLNNRQT